MFCFKFKEQQKKFKNLFSAYWFTGQFVSLLLCSFTFHPRVNEKGRKRMAEGVTIFSVIFKMRDFLFLMSTFLKDKTWWLFVDKNKTKIILNVMKENIDKCLFCWQYGKCKLKKGQRKNGRKHTIWKLSNSLKDSLVHVLSCFSHVWLCDPVDRLPCPWDSPGKNTWVGCYVLQLSSWPRG